MNGKYSIKCAACDGTGFIRGRSRFSPKHMNGLGEEVIQCPNHIETKIVVITKIDER